MKTEHKYMCYIFCNGSYILQSEWNRGVILSLKIKFFIKIQGVAYIKI